MNTFPTQRVPDHAETTPEQPRQYIATTPSGGKLLVTVWADTVEVAQRLGGRWGAPFQIEVAP